MTQTSPTPSAASVALVQGERVLLIRRARAPYQGLWTLPGGRLEAGEEAETAARREVREELGIAITKLAPLTTHAAGPWRLAVFVASAWEGHVWPSDEVLDWRWATESQVEASGATPGLSRIVHMALHTEAPLP